jgi:hypothetical protein
MKLTAIRVMTGSCTDGKTCPPLSLTDRGACVVAGQATGPEALGAVGIGPGEQAVEVPAPLLEGR